MLPGNFRYVTPIIAASAQPLNTAQVQALKENGIHSVVILVTRHELDTNPLISRNEYFEALARNGIRVYHIPIRHLSVPSNKQLRFITQLFQTNERYGRKTLVHCLLGTGRTGAVIAAYLIGKGYLLEQAARMVQGNEPNIMKFPESFKQEEFLKQLEREHPILKHLVPPPKRRTRELLNRLRERIKTVIARRPGTHHPKRNHTNNQKQRPKPR